MKFSLFILIESKWNLKIIGMPALANLIVILIESKWNLKDNTVSLFPDGALDINRIKVEFKVHHQSCLSVMASPY